VQTFCRRVRVRPSPAHKWTFSVCPLRYRCLRSESVRVNCDLSSQRFCGNFSATAFFPLLFLTGLRLSGLLKETSPGRKAPTGRRLFSSLCSLPLFGFRMRRPGVLASYSLALLFLWASGHPETHSTCASRGRRTRPGPWDSRPFYIVPAAYEQTMGEYFGSARWRTHAETENFLFAVTAGF